MDSDFYPSDQVMRLGQCVMDIFNGNVEGHFMWTVRNEREPRGEYVGAYDAGWINQNTSTVEIFDQWSIVIMYRQITLRVMEESLSFTIKYNNCIENCKL